MKVFILKINSCFHSSWAPGHVTTDRGKILGASTNTKHQVLHLYLVTEREIRSLKQSVTMNRACGICDICIWLRWIGLIQMHIAVDLLVKTLCVGGVCTWTMWKHFRGTFFKSKLLVFFWEESKVQPQNSFTHFDLWDFLWAESTSSSILLSLSPLSEA